MKNLLKLYTTLFIFLFLLIITDSNAQNKKNYDIRINECIELNRNRKYIEAKEKAASLINIGEKAGNNQTKMVGTALYVMSAVSIGNDENYEDYINFLVDGLNSINEKDTDSQTLSLIHKALGMYYHLILQDFPQSANHTFQALEYIRKANDARGEVDILCNLSSLYFQKNDSTGITYSTEAHAKAEKLNYAPGLYRTNANVANFYYNQRKFSKALNHLQEAMKLAEDMNYINEFQYLNSFLGDIYTELNDFQKAEDNYKLSIIDQPETSKYDKIYARFCYAIFLNRLKRHNESIKLLNEIDTLSKKWEISIFDKEIALNLSHAFESIGQFDKALDYYKSFDSIKEIQLNAEKEKEFSILDLKYKISEEKQKNAQQEIEILTQNRNQIILFFIIGVVLIIAIFIYIMYRRTQRRYREIVQTHIDNLETERKLKQQLESLKFDENNISNSSADKKEISSHGKYDRSSLSEKKSNDIYSQVEILMNEQKIYHDSELNIDKLAVMLNTNRTYLSQVINTSTGLSFSTYINNLRIKEAIELLSDPQNDEPVKSIAITIGFNSPSNFYTIFKNKVGMSPSAYRENVQKLSKSH